MSDADDAGLVERMRIVTTLPSRLRSQDDIDEKLLVAADRIEFQRQEIEELRRDVVEGVNHIHALMEAGPEGYAAAYKAASAFAAKHGGRDVQS